MRVYRIPFSTNVERIALAAGHKGIRIEWVDVPADDRSAVVAVSGQPLVPVLVEGDLVLHDSPTILRWLEERFPDPPLYPPEPARRAEVETFVDWFNLVWKRAPNLIADELAKPEPEAERIAAWGAETTSALDRFEALLNGRPFLFGEEVTVADVVAFPFVKYTTRWEDDDEEPFHAILRDWQPRGGHPAVEAWVDRMDALPRA
jgi:glutathione S-transferase